LARVEDADSRQKVRIDEASVRVRESDLALTLAGTREQEVRHRSNRRSMRRPIWKRRGLTTVAHNACSAKTRFPRRIVTRQQLH